TAGVEVDVASDSVAARPRWQAAPLVVVGDDQAESAAGPLGRRPQVILVGVDRADVSIWRRGVALGAEQVVYLPDVEHWLVERFADAAEETGRGAPGGGGREGRGGGGGSRLGGAP